MGYLTEAAGPTRSSTLYPFSTTVELQDDFMLGGTGDGSIGTLGWGSGGTVTTVPGQSNRPGIYNFATGAVLGTIARINMSGGLPLSLADTHRVTWVYRLSTNDANTTFRIGSSSSWVGLPPTNGIYVEKLDGDTNWFCVARASGVQTRIDTGIAVNTSFHTMSYVRNSSGVQFLFDNLNVCDLITTNIPTSTGGAGAMIVNSAAASKSFDIDYAQLIIAVTR